MKYLRHFFAILAIHALTCFPVAQAVTCTDATIPPSNPDSIYTDHGNGTVTDTRTGLMWKKCAEGQTWNGSTCTGSATVINWINALTLAKNSNFAGQTDWRLPNLKELRSLVEECRIGPTINDTIFPNTPTSEPYGGFLSSSPDVLDSNNAWYVYFNYGYASAVIRNDSRYSVRLVRDGQTSSAATTFNAAADFSPTSNLNGTWSYGWSASLGQPFQLFNAHVAGYPVGVDGWSMSNQRPSVQHNGTASELIFNGEILAPGALDLHPGPSGEVAIVRWTAPASGTYAVSVRFGGAEAGVANVLVLRNGVVLFQDIKNTSDPNGTYFSFFG